MTLLDAARQIAGREPLSAYGEVSSCLYCQAVRVSPYEFQPVTEHLGWCPWLLMPRIVAALEAADELSALVLHKRGWQYPSYGPGVPDDEVSALRYTRIAQRDMAPPPKEPA